MHFKLLLTGLVRTRIDKYTSGSVTRILKDSNHKNWGCEVLSCGTSLFRARLPAWCLTSLKITFFCRTSFKNESSLELANKHSAQGFLWIWLLTNWTGTFSDTLPGKLRIEKSNMCISLRLPIKLQIENLAENKHPRETFSMTESCEPSVVILLLVTSRLMATSWVVT